MATVRSVRKELEEVKETMAKQEGSFAWQMIRSKDRQISCLTKLIAFICLMWMLSTLGFIWFFNQYDFTTYDYQQDGSGINIIGDNNSEVTNHGTKNESKNSN